MLNFPKSTVLGRRIPKQKFYENLDVTPEIKQLFAEQIRLITWENKLSSATMNIARGDAVEEIEIIHIKLTGQSLDKRVMALMDKQIPYHILFILERVDELFQIVVSYKEASLSGANAFQLKQSYHTEWMEREALTLPLSGLDMDSLYENVVRSIAGDAIAAPEAESLKEAVEQTQEREKLAREIEKLRSKMKKEKRLAKQMEIRREIQSLEGK